MTTYNINDFETFKKDMMNGIDDDCNLQMWNTAKGIINDLEKFYNNDFTEEEIENDEDSLSTYFDDVLDIEYTIDSRLDYKGCEICLGWGGPGIWLDTNDGVIKCRWWGLGFNVYVSSELCELVDNVFEEYYNMVRC